MEGRQTCRLAEKAIVFQHNISIILKHFYLKCKDVNDIFTFGNSRAGKQKKKRGTGYVCNGANGGLCNEKLGPAEAGPS